MVLPNQQIFGKKIFFITAKGFAGRSLETSDLGYNN